MNNHDNVLFKTLALHAARVGKPLGYIKAHLVFFLAAQDVQHDKGINMFETQFVDSHFGPMVSGVSIMANAEAVTTSGYERYIEPYLDMPLDELTRLCERYRSVNKMPERKVV